MDHQGFFDRAGPFALEALAHTLAATLPDAASGHLTVDDVRPLDSATPADLAFIDNPKYLSQLAATRARACLVHPKLVARVPAHTVPLVTPEPYRAFARALALFYPDAAAAGPARDQAWATGDGIHATAEIEPGAIIEPGALIGPEAQVGRGTLISAGAVVGRRVAIGRDCRIGHRAVLTHALVGNRVIIHPGASIGQDGFGFAMGPQGHLKVPQIGRVIIQDDVEIGANTTIDRGALRDTVIGEGSKIDNLVQIGHNVLIGRHCVIVAQTGISGSTELGDFVVFGGQSAAIGHLKIGAGVQVAANGKVTSNIPAGERWGGAPARPMRLWLREVAVLKLLAERGLSGRSKSQTVTLGDGDGEPRG